MEKEVFDKLIKSLCELIRIPSRFTVPEAGAPRGKAVKDAIDYCLSLGLELGFTSCGSKDGVVGWLDVGEGKESFGILGHVDVVPEGGGWSVDPYGGEISGGRIYGRGASDDKGPLLCSMYAVSALLKEGKVPKKRIRVIIGGDEEGFPKVQATYALNDKDAMDIYKENEDIPESGFSPDADFPVINCEKGILTLLLTCPIPNEIENIKGGERPNIVPNSASATLSSGEVITAEGKSVHGSMPYNGVNAVTKLFQKLESKGIQEFSLFRQLFEDVYGKGFEIDFEDEVSGKLTLNLGIVEIKDDKLVLTVNIRYPVSFSDKEIVNKISKIWNGEVIVCDHKAPLYVPEDDPLVQALLDSYNSVTGKNAKPLAIGGGTYARELAHGVAFGASFPEQDDVAHMPDEYVSFENLEKTFEIYKKAIEKLCF